MKANEHLTDGNQHYYPEVIVVFLFLMAVGCVVGLAVGIACTGAIPW